MRILRPIVETPTYLVPIRESDLAQRRRISPKRISNDDARLVVFLQKPPQKLQRRGLVALRRDHCLENLALVIDGAPQG
jgi:hypothetical protein